MRKLRTSGGKAQNASQKGTLPNGALTHVYKVYSFLAGVGAPGVNSELYLHQRGKSSTIELHQASKVNIFNSKYNTQYSKKILIVIFIAIQTLNHWVSLTVEFQKHIKKFIFRKILNVGYYK